MKSIPRRINRAHSAGFTIVELATVVSVIVILATIVLITYPSYLATTHNNARKSDLQEIAAALRAYSLKNNTFIDATSTDGSGNACGYSGLGNGWFNEGPDGSYPSSISNCLKASGVLTKNIVDPSGCVNGSGSCTSSGNATAYMKATCTKSGNAVTYVFAHLEGEPDRDSEVDALCDDSSVAGFTSVTQKWGTNYGMNYYVTVR